MAARFQQGADRPKSGRWIAGGDDANRAAEQEVGRRQAEVWEAVALLRKEEEQMAASSSTPEHSEGTVQNVENPELQLQNEREGPSEQGGLDDRRSEMEGLEAQPSALGCASNVRNRCLLMQMLFANLTYMSHGHESWV